MSTDGALAQDLARLARASGRIAIDTEFMGEGRYRTLLCLVQVAVDEGSGGERIAILDPLAQDMPGRELGELLSDPAVEVIVHAGRQDVALLRRELRCEVRNVFDTQVAAGFAGLPAQASYETLLNELLRVRLRKSASFTRWDLRPLSEEQLGYAREDVVHLLALASLLQERLRAAKRLEWARQECRYLESISDERDVETILLRLPRVRGLSVVSQSVARELVGWREQTASARDKPVQTVMSDQALVEIAKRRPSNRSKLSEIRGVGQNNQNKRAEEILEAVRRGAERRAEPLPSPTRGLPPDPSDAPLIALSEALVRARASDAGLAYELLASRADLQAIVAGERTGRRAQVRTLEGWRGELVGEELLDLLDGRVSLSVQEGRLEIS
ncbi:MAG: ribonuclease D [Solirubrobacteraceae bacterium]